MSTPWFRLAGSGTLLLASTLVAWPAGVQAQEMLHVNGDKARQAASVKPPPDYPPMAKQLHIGGVVTLDAFIQPDGQVDKVEIVKGNPMLAAAATAALKKWKFIPFTQDGSPAKVVARLDFEFNP